MDDKKKKVTFRLNRNFKILFQDFNLIFSFAKNQETHVEKTSNS